MKVTVLGISRRKGEDKQGRPVTYSNIFYSQPFDDYTLQNGKVIGEKCGAVNTGLDTSGLFVGDEINLDYAPTGFTDKNGSPQFRLEAITIVKPFKNVFPDKTAAKDDKK
ncbi:MAG: hypothetical protein ACI4AA_10720 [Lachnospiraceae bacterium]